MTMSLNTAIDRLHTAAHRLNRMKPIIEKRERYVQGDQDLPFAPYGVNAEYLDLREQSIANFLRIAVDAPVQRMGVDSIATGLGNANADADVAAGTPDPNDPDAIGWANIWQANKLDVRQSLIYRSMFIHGRGIVSVWRNAANVDEPIVRPESNLRVHIEPDPEDPFTPLWAAKIFEVETRTDTGLVLPSGFNVSATKTVGIVYDGNSFRRFERAGQTGLGGTSWTQVTEGSHKLGRIPFAVYDMASSADGVPMSPIDTLMGQQDAVNTIRFNTLLAMQFAAFRQRIVTGFDPRVVDGKGNIVYQTNADGTPKLDPNGAMIPLVQSPGKVGVDRLLAFPGDGTKVFDLPESNLANYITVYDRFLTTFFATGQIPPQYLLTQMANLSGDALAAAESTLSSLVQQMQIAAGEGHEDMMSLGWAASERPERFPNTAETNWADREARSFSAIADAITKLISVEFPHRPAFEMLPGASKQKVDGWMKARQDEQYEKSLLNNVLRPPFDATTTAAPPAPAVENGDQLTGAGDGAA